MLIRICVALAFFTACIDDTSTDTQSSAIGDGIRDHRPPPPEAFAACTSATAGDTCAFDIDGHHIDGTCRNGPDASAPLACAPDHPPPPAEALEACASLTLDAACAFDIDGHHVEGTCKNGPDGDGPLACAPDRQ